MVGKDFYRLLLPLNQTPRFARLLRIRLQHQCYSYEETHKRSLNLTSQFDFIDVFDVFIIYMSPSVISVKRLIISIVVVFQLPDGPMIKNNSFDSISKFI